ncbi:MAG: NB-ARC domain-containing protein, partial [Anaerolineales bacterium]
MAEPTRCSVKRLRAALKAWDDAPALGEHELCSWRIAASRRRASGYEDTPAGRGLALRELLEAAIHELRPEAGEPQPDDPRWRNYRILQGRYLDGRSPDYLAEALAIARSTYNHAQLEAEKALLARLIEWEEGQPALESAVHRDDAAGAERPRPFMAPPRRPKGLTGREALFEQLRRSLVSAPGKQLALWGLPGVGKTALAVELAHDPAVREAYPDGVLWAGFGASPDLAVLQHLLASALGVPHELLAALDRLEDRARLIQHAAAGRSMLVVLDDIWREEHALAFHLGGETCALLITTRSPGLVQSLPEYEPVEVPELTLEASLRLLEQFAPGAVRARRAMLGEAIERIGGLPLTMVLVGGFLRRETYADQPRRLADALGKLREVENWGRVVSPVSPLESRPGLQAGAELSLFGVIGLSEQALEARARAALRSLSSFPPSPATFSEELALAAVGGKGEDLDLLVDAGLLEAAGDDRYRLHSAVWHYLASQDVDRERQIHFVGVVLAWMMAHSADPRTYEAEAASIQAAIEIASQVAMISELAGLAHHYFQYQKRAGLLEQALGTLRLAFTETEGSDYPRIRLMLSLDCGQACQRTGDYAGADRFYAEALDLARGLDEPDSHCAALQGL